MNFEGIYPPVITPFKEDYTIDFDGFEVVLEHLIASQVHGAIVGGTTGEYYAQSKDERVRLIQVAKEIIAGRLPLIAGIGAIRTEECIELGQIAKASGADAVLMNAPYYAVPTQEELAVHALAIDQAVGLPTMLYNYPGRTGTTMSKPFFDAVSDHPNFAAIKESTGDINQLHMLANDYPGITLLCGMDDQALEFFAWGARGWVCAGGNCLPTEHLALYQAVAVDSDIARGRRIMSALMPFMAILEQGGKLIQVIKHVCALRGLPAGPVRKPLQPLTDAEKTEIEQVLEGLRVSFESLTGESGSNPHAVAM